MNMAIETPASTAATQTPAAAATDKTATPAATAPAVTQTPAAAATKVADPAAKAGDPAAAAPAETVLTGGKPADPIKYELTLPKDSVLDAAHVAKIEAEAKAEGLTNEQAQGRLARDNQLKAEMLNQQATSLKEQSAKWVEELKGDKDFGGDNFKENVSHAKRALDRFADPAFKKILDETGLGNNPHLVRAFARVGKQMGNDKLVLGESGSIQKSSALEKLFPTMKQGE